MKIIDKTAQLIARIKNFLTTSFYLRFPTKKHVQFNRISNNAKNAQFNHVFSKYQNVYVLNTPLKQ